MVRTGGTSDSKPVPRTSSIGLTTIKTPDTVQNSIGTPISQPSQI